MRTSGTAAQAGSTARARALWSGDTLYLLAQVADPTLS
ncbi:sugar-binding protein, partial [Microbispora bryophytorum]